MATMVYDRSMLPKSGRQFGGAPLCPIYPANAPRKPSSPTGLSTQSGSCAGVESEDGFSDQCSLGDELSVPGSPTGSCQSDQGAQFLPTPKDCEDEFRVRRASFELPQQHLQHHHNQHQQQQQVQQPVRNRNERRGFLPKQPLASPSHSGTTSPDYSPQSSQSFPRVKPDPVAPPGPSPLFPSSSALFPSSSPLFPSSSLIPSSCPLLPSSSRQPSSNPSAPARPVGSGNSGKLPSLREQVLLRSSGELTEVGETKSEWVDDAEPEDNSECLNYEDVEAVCAERELEKDTVDGVHIVPLPMALAGPDSPEIVLYALVFTSNSITPVLPGDDSIKLLFPDSLQAAATGKQKRAAPKGNCVAPKIAAFQSFKPVAAGRNAVPPAKKVAAGTSIATFGSWKPTL